MKSKILTENFFLLLAVFALVSLFALMPVEVQAAPLSDVSDSFFVNEPRASSKIIGVSTFRFYLFDDDNEFPEYEVGLYKPDCLTKFGTIATNDHTIKGADNFYAKTWNSDGPILDQASIPNGNYCLKVCVTLINDALDPSNNKYSVCDLRPLVLTEKVNQNPVITTQVPNTLLLQGQTFGYDVNATDPDGDTLTYSLSSAPSFLQINNATGAISTIGTLDQLGSFVVVVSVSDGQGGVVTQEFTIRVVEQPSPELSNVEILTPTKDSVFRDDKTNEIKWQINNIDDVSVISLVYSSTGEDWIKISDVGVDRISYIWDVASIESDDYFVKIIVKEASGATFEGISEKFSIIASKEEIIEDSSSIVEVSPGEDEQLNEVKEISATLVPSTGSEIDPDTLIVQLDDEDITELCEIVENKLTCQFNFEVSVGRHKIYMEFQDTAGKKTSKQWFFEVVAAEEESSSEEDGEGANVNSVLIILGICLVVFLLLAIPWTLYMLWKRRGGDYAEEYPAYDYDDTGDPLDPVDDLTSSYDFPEAASEPVPEAVPPESESAAAEGEDDFLIGEGSLGGEDDYKPAESPTAPVAPKSTTSASVPAEQPAGGISPGADGQFGEEDVPDWLKTEDVSAGTQSGVKSSVQSSEDVKTDSPAPASKDAQKTQATSDTSTDAAALPIGPTGEEIDIDTVEEKKEKVEGAQPYGDYGLAAHDDNNNQE